MMDLDAMCRGWLLQGLQQPGKTRAGLAKALGVDPACITRALNGDRRLRLDELPAAARYLGLSLPGPISLPGPVDVGFRENRQAADPRLGVARKAPVSHSIRMRVEPRDVPARKIARLLHLTPDEFEAIRHALFLRGFPKPDPLTGMFDLKFVHLWMDKRHDVTFPTDASFGYYERLSQIDGQRRRRLKRPKGSDPMQRT